MVVMNYGLWLDQIRDGGFETTPVVTRLASFLECRTMKRRSSFPAWVYEHVDDLIDDEIKTGTPSFHLKAIVQATSRFRRSDHPVFAPVPSAASS